MDDCRKCKKMFSHECIYDCLGVWFTKKLMRKEGYSEEEIKKEFCKLYIQPAEPAYIELIAWDSRKIEAIHLGTINAEQFEKLKESLDNGGN